MCTVSVASCYVCDVHMQEKAVAGVANNSAILEEQLRRERLHWQDKVCSRTRREMSKSTCTHLHSHLTGTFSYTIICMYSPVQVRAVEDKLKAKERVSDCG